MTKKTYLKAVGLGVVGLLILTAVVKGEMRLGKLPAGQEKVEEERSWKGSVPQSINGEYNIKVTVFADEELQELLAEKIYPQVQIQNGMYNLPLKANQLNLATGQEYWMKVEIDTGKEVFTKVQRLLVSKDTRILIEEADAGGSLNAQNPVTLIGSDPNYMAGVWNKSTGYGVYAKSDSGTGLYSEAGSNGYAIHAKNINLAGAIKAEGNVDVEGDLTVIGETSLNSVSLPDNSVGSAKIEDGSIVNADIADNTITVDKIVDGRDSGLDADKLDGIDSTGFISALNDVTLQGNLTVNGAGNNYFAGNVGIGTATPQSRLSIWGSNAADEPYAATLAIGRRPDGTATSFGLWYDSAVGWHQDVDASGSMSFHSYTGGIWPTRVIFKEDGKVGIGTTAPIQELEVHGMDGNVDVRVQGSATRYMDFYIQPLDNGVGGLYMYGPGDMHFATNSVERLRITNDGNVGIGTIAPLKKLNVFSGEGDPVADILLSGTPGTTRNHFIAVRDSGYTFRWGQAYNNQFQIDYDSNNDAAFAANLFTAQANGNVGIGTKSPLKKLDVFTGQGDSTADILLSGDPGTTRNHFIAIRDSGYTFRWGQAYNNQFQIDYDSNNDATFANNIMTAQADGKVGIGTKSPAHKLDVAGDIQTGRNGSGGAVFLGNSGHGLRRSGNDVDVFTAGGDGDVKLLSEMGKLVLKPAGSVGIGTEDPQATLDVVGNIQASGVIQAANVIAQYQDLAEWVPSFKELEAGMVVVIDQKLNNHVMASSRAYDSKVAGVVSAQPGLLLGKGGENQYMVASTGRVKVKVDASYGVIKIGDLLVTSPVEGTAMKSQPKIIDGDAFHRPGTILGKALEALSEGQGEILVLLSLQ